jgi:VWFA-related protein
MHTTGLLTCLGACAIVACLVSTPRARGARLDINHETVTDTVTLEVRVQDPDGIFIPDIRPENFAVYQGGVRQSNVTVDVEHAAIRAGLLVEYGGRYHALNEALAATVPTALSQFLDETVPNDALAIWKYGDRVEQIVGFSLARDQPLQDVAVNLRAVPPFSELNLYDALLATLPQVVGRGGRKALILFSSGIDTFSKASYSQVLRAAGRSGVPLYAIDLGPALRQNTSLYGFKAPYDRLDWKRAESTLRGLARASGGRLYSPPSTSDLTAMYDDLMAELRVRYLITYKAAERGRRGAVRVELVNSRTGGPLTLTDANGKTVRARVILEAS